MKKYIKYLGLILFCSILHVFTGVLIQQLFPEFDIKAIPLIVADLIWFIQTMFSVIVCYGLHYFGVKIKSFQKISLWKWMLIYYLSLLVLNIFLYAISDQFNNMLFTTIFNWLPLLTSIVVGLLKLTSKKESTILN